jgi:hypothetical protein
VIRPASTFYWCDGRHSNARSRRDPARGARRERGESADDPERRCRPLVCARVVAPRFGIRGVAHRGRGGRKRPRIARTPRRLTNVGAEHRARRTAQNDAVLRDCYLLSVSAAEHGYPAAHLLSVPAVERRRPAAHLLSVPAGRAPAGPRLYSVSSVHAPAGTALHSVSPGWARSIAQVPHSASGARAATVIRG